MASEASTAPRDRVNQAELARRLGVKRQAIGDLVTRGLLTVDADGLIDFEAARVELANTVRPSGKTGQALAALAPAPAAAPAAGAPPPAEPTTAELEAKAVTSFHVARTLNEAANAAMNQLKLREMQGDLISVASVERIWGSFLASAREHLMQMRARLAPMLAAESDAFQVDQILDAEISAALTQLAGADVRKPEK